MMKFIDTFLNQTTMYRLVLYYVVFLFLAALGLSVFGLIPFQPLFLLLSAVYITGVCWLLNTGFAYVFGAATNVESVFITAGILVLIISPPAALFDISFLFFGYMASAVAIGSKYLLAIGKKHVFNPAAIAVVVTSFLFNLSASWWVGTTALVPFVFIGGLLVVRKIHRFDLVATYFLVAVAGILGSRMANPATLLAAVSRAILSSPLFFFAFAMLTEPLTTPPTGTLRVWYGAIVGFLFVPVLHVGSVYSTPELALIVGNIFSYLVSPKLKLALTLKEIRLIATDTYEFVFSAPKPVQFNAGQYLEWTLAHVHPDNRGNRRYFTIASAPGSSDVALGVKFYPESSSFKTSMLALKPGDTVMASQLAGDFVLPKKTNMPLVFIAGGIGVTPFHSMIQYLLNRKEDRSILMFYSGKSKADFAYTKDFDEAETKLGMKTVYTITDEKAVPSNWKGEHGVVTDAMIKKYIPNVADHTFYLSGPHGMVVAFDKTLQQMGVAKSRIKKDFFPGLV